MATTVEEQEALHKWASEAIRAAVCTWIDGLPQQPLLLKDVTAEIVLPGPRRRYQLTVRLDSGEPFTGAEARDAFKSVREHSLWRHAYDVGRGALDDELGVDYTGGLQRRPKAAITLGVYLGTLERT